MRSATLSQIRKIIHVDMDCFYAAVEIRDNPSLADKPVAVGGSSASRGVLCTCNYVARQYGIHSAMPTATALKLCKDLVLLPVNMAKYKAVAQRIHRIFLEFTDLVEPLALDEAYLDVTGARHYQGSATFIAQAIRYRIWETEKLTASAGVAPNKFLAKIASGWKKPNGLFIIPPEQVSDFIQTLPIKELYGVGKVTAEKLHSQGLTTCADMQKLTLSQLTAQFGKVGQRLYEQCRGMDTRSVESARPRKSLSIEHTFPQDMNNQDLCLAAMQLLFEKLQLRIKENAAHAVIKNQFIKIKFNNFRLITAEIISSQLNLQIFQSLFIKSISQYRKPIRLIGLGVHFNPQSENHYQQQSFFT